MIKFLIAILVSTSILFASCSNYKDLLNSPATQQVITDAEAIAIQFANDWIHGLHATRGGKATAEAKATAAIKARYPNMADNLVSDIVAAKFAAAK